MEKSSLGQDLSGEALGRLEAAEPATAESRLEALETLLSDLEAELDQTAPSGR
jgi:hypothetical protein